MASSRKNSPRCRFASLELIALSFTHNELSFSTIKSFFESDDLVSLSGNLGTVVLHKVTEETELKA